MCPAADDTRASAGFAVTRPLRRLQCLRSQGGRIGDSEPAEGLIGGRQQRPGRPQPVAAGGRVPGQRFRLAGHQVSGMLVVSQPDGLWSGDVQGLTDEVVGKFEVAPGGHQQPRLQSQFTVPQGSRRRHAG
jgi:hypothetical protein